MKRESQWNPGLFDAPAWEQEKQAPEPDAPAVAVVASEPKKPIDGQERWILARADVLGKIRGMSPGSALAVARLEFDEWTALDTIS